MSYVIVIFRSVMLRKFVMHFEWYVCDVCYIGYKYAETGTNIFPPNNNNITVSWPYE